MSGTSNRPLAEKISQKLNKPLAIVDYKKFSDGEIFVEIKEHVRGRDVYIIQSTSAPTNDSLMELLITIDALKRASAKDINAVIPYFGYARQDRKVQARSPISAKLVADILTAAGATRVISADLHAGQIQGFFNIPIDNLFAAPVLAKALEKEIPHHGDELVIVSPDAGGVERARKFAARLHASVAMIDKRRLAPNVAKAMNVVGNVNGKHAIIVDDMIDTAGSLTEAARTIIEHGALSVSAAATHGVFSGPAVQRIQDSPLEKVIITDTILHACTLNCPKIQVASIADLLGEAIYRIHNYDSLSELFDQPSF